MTDVVPNPAPLGAPNRDGSLDVSIVMPVLNEGGHLAAELSRIKSAMDESSLSYEVIVVDDGSTDGTQEVLRSTVGVKSILFGQNRGTGSARKAGTRAASGRVVVWTDGDMTLPNHDIPRLVKELEGHDQVVGARTSEKGSVKLLRTPTKWLIRKLACYLLRRSIPDLNCGFRAFRRDVGLQFLHLLPKGFSCTTTMTMTFLANGYSVHHYPIEYRARTHGKSNFHWWSDTKEYLTQVIRMMLSYEPLRLFLPAGLGLIFAALGKMAYDWVTKDFRLTTNTLLLFFAAFQTFSIGFLADLIVRFNKPLDPVPAASLATKGWDLADGDG